MNKLVLTSTFLFGLVINAGGCGGGDDDDDDSAADSGSAQTGTLTMHMRIGDHDRSRATKAVHTLEFVDVYHTVHSLHAATEIAEESTAFGLSWQPIHVDGTAMYDSDLEINAELPAGVYNSIRVEHSNAMTWVCTNGTKNYEFPSLNQSGEDPDTHLIQVFTIDANFACSESGTCSPGAAGEKMGTAFEIVADSQTNLTMRTNLDTLDWDDADENDEWTEGVDSLDNWTTIPGTDTMVDFIVE